MAWRWGCGRQLTFRTLTGRTPIAIKEPLNEFLAAFIDLLQPAPAEQNGLDRAPERRAQTSSTEHNRSRLFLVESNSPTLMTDF
jgi:hypothetical protein